MLAIIRALEVWCHFLEGAEHTFEIWTDHKNLEYFSTTKMLTRRQARWSEFLSQFNMVIRFRPGKLGVKPDSLTRRWDVYLKEGDSTYGKVNPQNFRPVFTSEQLRASIRASTLAEPVLRAAFVIDVELLLDEIRTVLATDHEILSKLDSPRWTRDDTGLIRCDGWVYVPDSGDLRLRVLHMKHDHPTAGHFGQNKTLALIRQEFTWPNLRSMVNNYVHSCTSCTWSKAPRHKPYGTL